MRNLLLFQIVVCNIIASSLGTQLKYTVNSTRLSWTDAEEECQRTGGHLISILDSQHNREIRYKLEDANIRLAWIGISDRSLEGSWRWISILSSSQYKNFRGNEPNGGERENCGEMVIGLVGWSKLTWNGTWNDSPCAVKKPFVCEQKSDVTDGIIVLSSDAPIVLILILTLVAVAVIVIITTVYTVKRCKNRRKETCKEDVAIKPCDKSADQQMETIVDDRCDQEYDYINPLTAVDSTEHTPDIGTSHKKFKDLSIDTDGGKFAKYVTVGERYKVPSGVPKLLKPKSDDLSSSQTELCRDSDIYEFSDEIGIYEDPGSSIINGECDSLQNGANISHYEAPIDANCSVAGYETMEQPGTGFNGDDEDGPYQNNMYLSVS